MKYTTVFKKNVRATKRIVVNQGGTSSSKTWSILQILYLTALKNEYLISVVAETLPRLKKGAMRDFFKMLKAEGIYKRENHNKTDHQYKVGKSIIEFFSADADDAHGARRDILFMNEVQYQTKAKFDHLETRTEHKIYLDYNPTHDFWMQSHVLIRDDVDYIHSTYLDNDQLSDNIKRSIEMRRGDENYWKVYGLGETGSNEGLIFEDINLVDEIPEDAEFIAYGLDFGFAVDPTVLIAVYRYNAELYIDELIYDTGLHNRDIAKKMIENKVETNQDIIADSADPKSIDWLCIGDKANDIPGFNVIPAKKGKDSIRSGIEVLSQYTKNVTKRSVNVIKEFRNYSWKQDKNEEYLPVPIDDWNHAIDAIRYVALNRLAVKSVSWVDDF